MRLFEAVLLASTAAAILRRLADWRRHARPSGSPAIAAALLVVLALHLALEGWRAQMLPAYVTVMLLVGIAVVPAMRAAAPAGSPRAGMPWVCGAALLSILLAAGLATARPVFTTPPPRGPAAVGTLSLDALYGSPPVRIWFPAQRQSEPHYAPYRREARAPDRRASLSRTQSMLDATPIAAPERLPVLIFFPGWGTLPSSNTVLLQDLASNGFVVVAADAWDAGDYPDDAGAAADLAVPLVFDSDRDAAAAMATGARNAVRQAALARRVLHRLDLLDVEPAGVLVGRLALDQVGMLGFSFGGSVAVQTALDDPRLRAVANLDGSVFTDAYRRGFRQPYLLLSEPPASEAPLAWAGASARREAVLDRQDEAQLQGFLHAHGGVRAIIAGTRHGNFTDAPLLSILHRHGGSIDPERARAIIDDTLVAFFDRQLLGAATASPTSLRRTYPELTLQVWPAGPQSGAGKAPVSPPPL